MFGAKVRVIPLAAGVALAVVACSADPGTKPLPGAASSAAATPTATASATPAAAVPVTVVKLAPVQAAAPQAALLDGYRRFWLGLTEAYRTGRPAALVEATVDPARARFVKRTTDLRTAGQTQRGTVLGSPLVLDLAGGVVADCMDLRDFRTYDSSGKALFPRDAGTTRIRATLRSVAGRWRLADFETEGSGCRR